MQPKPSALSPKMKLWILNPNAEPRGKKRPETVYRTLQGWCGCIWRCAKSKRTVQWSKLWGALQSRQVITEAVHFQQPPKWMFYLGICRSKLRRHPAIDYPIRGVFCQTRCQHVDSPIRRLSYVCFYLHAARMSIHASPYYSHVPGSPLLKASEG